MSNRDFKQLCNLIEQEINVLDSTLTVLSIDDVLTIMGFPKDWKKMKKAKK